MTHCVTHCVTQDLDLEHAKILMEAARLAVMQGGIEIGEECVKRCNGSKDMEIVQNMDLIRALCLVKRLGPDADYYTDSTVAPPLPSVPP